MAERLTFGSAVRNVVATLLLIGAAAPGARDDAVRAAAVQDVRLATVGYRLARGCNGLSDKAPLLTARVSMPGLVVQDITQYDEADRPSARRALKIGDGPTVVHVISNSAADRAKLRPGDRIVAVNGNVIDASAARDRYARMAQFDRFLAKSSGPGDWMVEVMRANGARFSTVLASEGGCASLFQVIPGRKINARADGTYVQVNGAMMDFAATDDDLAVVVAHELAHNVLGHHLKNTASKQAEYEADRFGVWLVARAGYDVDAALPFWTRLERRTNPGIFADGSHPSPKKRLAAVAIAVATLKAQVSAGQALVPPAQ